MSNKQISEIERQERNGKLVTREILACQSGLVSELLEKGILQYEDIENLYETCKERESNSEYWCEACKNGDYCEDTQPQEIYEWWLVSEWMYNKLREQDEPVLNYGDFNFFWGRCCTGQAIKLDYVIDKICNDLGW